MGGAGGRPRAVFLSVILHLLQTCRQAEQDSQNLALSPDLSSSDNALCLKWRILTHLVLIPPLIILAFSPSCLVPSDSLGILMQYANTSEINNTHLSVNAVR